MILNTVTFRFAPINLRLGAKFELTHLITLIRLAKIIYKLIGPIRSPESGAYMLLLIISFSIYSVTCYMLCAFLVTFKFKRINRSLLFFFLLSIYFRFQHFLKAAMSYETLEIRDREIINSVINQGYLQQETNRSIYTFELFSNMSFVVSEDMNFLEFSSLYQRARKCLINLETGIANVKTDLNLSMNAGQDENLNIL